MCQPTIFVVDDQEPFRRVLRAVAAAAGCAVAGEAQGSADAIAQLGELRRPDLVMVDVQLGDESGIDLARSLVEADPRLRVVLVSTLDLADLPSDVATSGTIGFVPKSQIDPDLLRQLTQGSPPGECWHPRQDTP